MAVVAPAAVVVAAAAAVAGEANHRPVSRKYEIDFLAQIRHASPVTIETAIEKIGSKSLVVLQKAFQNSNHVATGRTVIIYLDYESNATAEIPDDIRRELENHLA